MIIDLLKAQYKDQDNIAAEHFACNKLQILIIILKNDEGNVHAKDQSGKTPLHYVV